MKIDEYCVAKGVFLFVSYHFFTLPQFSFCMLVTLLLFEMLLQIKKISTFVKWEGYILGAKSLIFRDDFTSIS